MIFHVQFNHSSQRTARHYRCWENLALACHAPLSLSPPLPLPWSLHRAANRKVPYSYRTAEQPCLAENSLSQQCDSIWQHPSFLLLVHCLRGKNLTKAKKSMSLRTLFSIIPFRNSEKKNNPNLSFWTGRPAAGIPLGSALQVHPTHSPHTPYPTSSHRLRYCVLISVTWPAALYIYIYVVRIMVWYGPVWWVGRMEGSCWLRWRLCLYDMHRLGLVGLVLDGWMKVSSWILESRGFFLLFLLDAVHASSDISW